MATSGSVQTTHRVSGNYDTYAQLDWSIASQDDSGVTIQYTYTGKTANSYQNIVIYGTAVYIEGEDQGIWWTGTMYNGTNLFGTGEPPKTKRINYTGSKTLTIKVRIKQFCSAESCWYEREASWDLPYIQPTPTFTPKLYCSVNGRAKRVKKLYCSVGGQAKQIKKLYASVNGEAKLIYDKDIT